MFHCGIKASPYGGIDPLVVDEIFVQPELLWAITSFLQFYQIVNITLLPLVTSYRKGFGITSFSLGRKEEYGTKPRDNIYNQHYIFT